MRQLLLATLVLFVALFSRSSQAEQPAAGTAHSPVVTITEPKVNKVIRLGDTLHVAWNVAGPFSHPGDWDLLVYLQDCAIARVPLYEGPIRKSPNHLNWVLTTRDVTPQMERGDTTSLSVNVCLYNKRKGNEELLAMSLSCKAALTVDVFICATSNSTVVLKP